MSQKPEELSTLAYHWVLQRPDGAGFATTSNDRPQWLGNVRMESNMDLRPSEVVISDQLFGSAMQLDGGLSSTAISAGDLKADRWSGAAVQLLAGNWDRSDEPVLLSEGTLGGLQVDGDRLITTADPVPTRAYRPACIQTSPECRATLGDRRCSVDMRPRQRRVKVVGVEGETIILESGDYADFRVGRIRWLSGERCGTEQVIVDVSGASLRLLDGRGAETHVGDVALITEGCDGRRTTCSARFNNIANFRGEPDLPGSEILMRFPGA